MREHLATARRLGATRSLLRTLQVNLANALEDAGEREDAARTRRELFELPEEAPATCAHCGAKSPPHRCGRCRAAFFCSAECQRKAWPVHKHECRSRDYAAERARALRECPVCLEEIDLARATSIQIRILQCVHVVHEQCWRNFAESKARAEESPECPLCRDSLAHST